MGGGRHNYIGGVAVNKYKVKYGLLITYCSKNKDLDDPDSHDCSIYLYQHIIDKENLVTNQSTVW